MRAPASVSRYSFIDSRRPSPETCHKESSQVYVYKEESEGGVTLNRMKLTLA